MLPRRSLLCLAALTAVTACQRPPPAQEARPAPAPQPTAQQAPPPPHAASAPGTASARPDAGSGAPSAPRRVPLPSPRAQPMPTEENAPGSDAPEEGRGAPQALLLKDSGVRCITFPCPSYSVQAEGAAEPREVHELDLSALPSDAERERVQEGLQQGVRVEGTLGVRRRAGPAGDATVLRVTRLLK